MPNSLHAEWSIKAANAGKHILCEKPLAVSGAEARSMFEAARRNKVHLVEAYPYMAQPQTLKVRELVRSGVFFWNRSGLALRGAPRVKQTFKRRAR